MLEVEALSRSKVRQRTIFLASRLSRGKYLALAWQSRLKLQVIGRKNGPSRSTVDVLFLGSKTSLSSS